MTHVNAIYTQTTYYDTHSFSHPTRIITSSLVGILVAAQMKKLVDHSYS
jgi:hypothetical protein